MVFAVISFAPGITPAEREWAVAGSPPCTASPAPYPDLLNDSGWDLVEWIDVTAEFAEAARRDLQAYEARSKRLEEALGKVDLAERMARRRARVHALDQELIRRELFVTRPAAGD